MAHLALTLVKLLIAIYWIGNAARQNKKINALVEYLEEDYGQFNERIRNAKVRGGLIILRRIYGLAAALMFVGVFAAARFFGSTSFVQEVIMYAFLIAFGGWFSIKWFTEHRKTLYEYRWVILFTLLCPLLYRALDLLTDTPIMAAFVDAVRPLQFPGGWQIPDQVDPNIVTAVMIAFMTTGLLLYYLLTWIVLAPLALFSLSVVIIPVYLARAIHFVAPDKSFIGFTIFVYASIEIFQASSTG